MARIIEQYYDKLASKYDDATSKPGSWIAPVECARLLEGRLKSRMSILDLGIGTGRSLKTIVGRGHNITGIDISHAMLRRARRQYPRARLMRADLNQSIPLSKDARFDLVLAVGVFEFVREINMVIQGATRHLRPQGFLCFTFEELIEGHALQKYHRSTRGWGLTRHVPQILSFSVFRHKLPEVESILISNGFSVVRQKRFVAYSLRSSISRKKYGVIYRAIVAQRIGAGGPAS